MIGQIQELANQHVIVIVLPLVILGVKLLAVVLKPVPVLIVGIYQISQLVLKPQ
jgi:hypothetical protein